jgi:hypothetical protein
MIFKKQKDLTKCSEELLEKEKRIKEKLDIKQVFHFTKNS